MALYNSRVNYIMEKGGTRLRVINKMVHSLLIVGGTREKRFRTTQNNSERQSVRVSELPSVGDARVPEFRSLRSSGSPRPRRTEFSEFSDRPSYSEFSEFDTTILEPEEDKQTISIDQIRDLQHQLSLRPHSAKYKTGIILEAQRMTVEAQNALLKTLEEPPARSILILTAPSTKSLLPTIVSRCQIERLPSEIDLDLESEEHREAAAEFLELLQQGRGERLAWIEENKKTITSNQLLATNYLDIWISVLRDLLLINSDRQKLVLNPAINNLTIQQFNHSSIDNTNLISGLEAVIKTKNLISSTNVSPRLALEVLLLDLPQLAPSVSEGE